MLGLKSLVLLAMRKLIFLSVFFLFISKFVVAEISLVEPTPIDFQGEIYVNDYSGTYKFSLEGTLQIILDPNYNIPSSSLLFAGVSLVAKKNVYSIQPKWFSERIEQILSYFQSHKNMESLFDEKNPQDLWKAFACRAFIAELSDSLQNDGSYAEKDRLVQKMQDRYIKAGLMYVYKHSHQLKTKQPPKFGTIVNVLQPLMASFSYGDAWLAISECFAMSERFTKGKDIFRDYFLNLPLMMVMRRQYQIPFSENKVAWSLLQMPDNIFVVYCRESLRRWMDQDQYRMSKIEKKTKVDEIPPESRGREPDVRIP